MKNLILHRVHQSPIATLGKLFYISDEGDKAEFSTIERPWLNNKPYESCIPARMYLCERAFYNKGGYPCFQIMEVPNRTHILFHVGNFVKDVVGCVAVGLDTDYKNNMITNSKLAFSMFMKLLENDDRFLLNIISGK